VIAEADLGGAVVVVTGATRGRMAARMSLSVMSLV
jgi:hypothetical protein